MMLFSGKEGQRKVDLMSMVSVSISCIKFFLYNFLAASLLHTGNFNKCFDMEMCLRGLSPLSVPCVYNKQYYGI